MRTEDLSIHRIIQIKGVVRFTDCAAHCQYLSLVVEDVRHDTHDHIRRPQQPRLAWIADHLARRIQFRLACAVEIRPGRGCRLLAERLDGGYMFGDACSDNLWLIDPAGDTMTSTAG